MRGAVPMKSLCSAGRAQDLLVGVCQQRQRRPEPRLQVVPTHTRRLRLYNTRVRTRALAPALGAGGRCNTSSTSGRKRSPNAQQGAAGTRPGWVLLPHPARGLFCLLGNHQRCCQLVSHTQLQSGSGARGEKARKGQPAPRQ